MKKKVILLIIFGFTLLPINSQLYDALLDTSKTWSIVKLHDCPGTCQITRIYKVLGDTTIENKSYFQLFRARDSAALEFYSQNLFLREDTAERIVYYLSYNNQEKILYNFSINIDDTITIDNNGCIKSIVVTMVDTIIINGAERKRLEFANKENEFLTEYWIEGIGSTFGLTQVILNNCTIDAATKLLCVSQSELLLYSNPEFNSCYLTAVYPKSSIHSPSRIILSPNPVRDQSVLSISGIKDMRCKLEIFDIMGRKHFSGLVDTPSKHIIDRSDFKPGIYIGRIIIGNQIINKIKIHII